MARILKWLSFLFLATPVLAYADPVPVTISGSGMMHPSSIWMYQFGEADVPGTSELLPFTLSVATAFDPNAANYSGSTDPLSPRSHQLSAPASISLTVNGATYNFSGNASILATFEPDRYWLGLGFNHSFYYFQLSVMFHDPANGMAGDPLDPRTLTTSDGLSAQYRLYSIPLNPDAPGNWEDSGALDNATLNVVSVVPEPMQAGMLMAGLLSLMAEAQMRRFRVIQAMGI